jgi:hypothetical protein
VPLSRLFEEGATPEIWDQLSLELEHQGDIGEASIAAVPWLLEYSRRQTELEWNVFYLIAVIELARPRHCKNHPMPPELAEGYFLALGRLPEVVGAHVHKDWSSIVMQYIAACIALARGQRLLARTYLEMDRDGAVGWLIEAAGFDEREVRRWANE